MKENYFEFDGKCYNITKLVSYTVLTPYFYESHSFEDGFLCYYKKRLNFIGGEYLELKSDEFFVPKYIHTGKTKKFLLFFTIKEITINPVWEMIDNKCWVKKFEEEENKEYDNISFSRWFSVKTKTEKLFDEIYYKCTILKERMDKTIGSENA